MTDLDAFERRLVDALLRYADVVTATVDAAAVARRVQLEHPRRGATVLPGHRVAPRMRWALLAAALLAAVAAAAVFVATRPDRLPRHPEPLVPSGIAVLTPDGGEYADMVADVDGTLWAVGPGRLVRFDPSTGSAREWTAADDAAFAADAEGRAWVGLGTILPARDGGVWLIEDRALRWFDGEAFRDVVETPERISTATEAPDGGLWVATEGGDVLHWDGSSWGSLGDPRPRDDDSISAIAADAEGRAWVGGEGWVSRHDGSSWTTLGSGDHRLFDLDAVALAPLADGSAWVVTDSGLARFHGSTWTVTAPAPWDGIPMTASWGPDGDVWVAGGSRLFGPPAFVSHFDGRTWVTYGQADGLSGANARGVVATSGGTYVVDGGVIEGFSEIAGPPGSGRWRPVRDAAARSIDRGALLAVSRDELWVVGSEGGIWRFANGTWTQDRPAPVDGRTRDLALAPDGTLWAAGTDGVSSRRDGRWTVVDPTEADAVHVDTDGTVWAGGASGVWTLRPEGARWTREALPVCPLPVVSSLAVDANGVVWAATAAGIESTHPGTTWAGAPGLARFDGTAWERTWEIGGSEILGATVLGIAPDGRVRVEALLPATAEQTAIDEEPAHGWVARDDGSAWITQETPADTCGLTMAADGTAWASTQRGPAAGDGQRWTFPYPGVSLDCPWWEGDAIAVAADGTSFLNHGSGIWSFAARPTSMPPTAAP